ncbi:MAG: AI-2E family transporter, partial [Firmicutes bacterium]|nr:AI-2E family transporter [Bacillota bacterium]
MKEKISRLKPWQQGLLLLIGGLFIVLLIIWIIKVRQALFSAMSPFLFALIAAYLLAPLVNCMERRRISRPVAIAVLYIVFAIVIFIFCVRVVPLFLDDLQELARQLPSYAADLQRLLHRMEEGYRR